MPAAQIRNYWRDVKEHLEPAIDLSNGRWTESYVLAGLVLNEQNLWVIVDNQQDIVGAVTTEIVSYPEKRALAMHFLGGHDFDLFYPELFTALTNFAKETNCAVIETNARFGFWKWFKDSGFTRPSAFYELCL